MLVHILVVSVLPQSFRQLLGMGWNTLNVAPAWCEISIRIIMGASVGLPAASLCINRRLYNIAIVRSVVVTKAEKRRTVLIDSMICGVFLPSSLAPSILSRPSLQHLRRHRLLPRHLQYSAGLLHLCHVAGHHWARLGRVLWMTQCFLFEPFLNGVPP
ncbi:unnamed protein product [Mycena citricolor]|uniref:Pheromone receptor n=1 Tax=Mycena citricolor TaxID=2018698 RepID=A0AAD2HB70_9AGAR|nr:unnamed protein product [Mycena citricolor]